MFGEKIVGKKIDVGEIPLENEVLLNQRSREEEDEVLDESEISKVKDGKGKKLERRGESHLYLVVKDKKTGNWGLPTGELQGSEGLHEVGLLVSLAIS